MAQNSARDGTGGHRDVARYECRCGNVVKFHEDEFDHLHWLNRKFNFRNVSSAIAHQIQCCDRPEYMETSLRSEVKA